MHTHKRMHATSDEYLHSGACLSWEHWMQAYHDKEPHYLLNFGQIKKSGQHSVNGTKWDDHSVRGLTRYRVLTGDRPAGAPEAAAFRNSGRSGLDSHR